MFIITKVIHCMLQSLKGDALTTFPPKSLIWSRKPTVVWLIWPFVMKTKYTIQPLYLRNQSFVCLSKVKLRSVTQISLVIQRLVLCLTIQNDPKLMRCWGILRFVTIPYRTKQPKILESMWRLWRWTCHVYPVEVGCHGFADRSVVRFLTDIGVAPRPRSSPIRQLH